MQDASKPSGPFRNRLLAALPEGELDIVMPHLDAVTLRRRDQLEQPRKAIENLYFIEHGIASVVSANDPSRQIEIGLIENEGITGLPVILGSDRSCHSTYVQIAGDALRISVRAMREALDRSAQLRSILLRYVQAFVVQTAATAVANAKASIEERLARWVLMAHDRVEGDEISLTHEFLALMLGTRRPGVTVGLHALAKQGLIRADRGVVVVIDREGLIEHSGKFYGEPESEFDRLIGTQSSKINRAHFA